VDGPTGVAKFTAACLEVSLQKEKEENNGGAVSWG
jgi:hypothetical protein